MPGALVEITTILLFVSLRARTNAHTDSHTPTHSTSHADISLLVCLSSATVTTRSSASQHSELPGHHQKEQNASKSDKAQCSFCGFSETRPSLSPTHICTITNRCPKIPSQPAYRKLALCPSVYYSIFSVTTSGSVTLHFLNSISSAHVRKRSGQKPMQMLERWMGAGEGKKTLKCTHPCSPLCSDLSNKSTIMRNHYFCYAFMALLLHYTLMLSPPYSASPSPPLFHIK